MPPHRHAGRRSRCGRGVLLGRGRAGLGVGHAGARSPPSYLFGALPAVAGPAPAQVKRGLKLGLWQKRHRPDGWVLYQSRSYQIQSQAGLHKAKRLAKHTEGMIAVYKKLFPPGKSLLPASLRPPSGRLIRPPFRSRK